MSEPLVSGCVPSVFYVLRYYEGLRHARDNLFYIMDPFNQMGNVLFEISVTQ